MCVCVCICMYVCMYLCMYVCNVMYVCMHVCMYVMHVCMCGPVSSVGIATDYGLDDPGSNPKRDEIFRPSKPALGPTQPPVKWVPCLSRG